MGLKATSEISTERQASWQPEEGAKDLAQILQNLRRGVAQKMKLHGKIAHVMAENH